MKMKRVKCRSGQIGWQAKLHEIYSNFEEFETYSDMYGLAARLGYKKARNAWLNNPTVEGSVVYGDFRRVRP